jgi:hypothetical protein
MTVQQIVLHMLSYIGVRDLNPANNTNSTSPGMASGGDGAYGDIQFALNKLNMAMQQIFRDGPKDLSERPGGGVIKPPRNILVTVTQFSNTITVVSGWEADMVGCSVTVNGDSGGENLLLSSTRLARPHPGASGTVSAVVYHDAIALASDVRTVIDPIEMPNWFPPIVVVTTEADLNTFNSGYAGTKKMTAQPRAALVTTIFTDGAPKKFLRLNPLPDQIYPVRWREKVDPPHYVMADVIATGDEEDGPFTDPGKVLPLHWVESVLLPIATELFVSHPSFSNSAAEKAIQKEAAIARSIMLPDEAVSRTGSAGHYPNRIPTCR